MTAVEFTFKPAEAMTMENARIQTFGPPEPNAALDPLRGVFRVNVVVNIRVVADGPPHVVLGPFHNDLQDKKISRDLRIFTSEMDFTETILRWYAENGRDLPWRRTRDPYAVWLSEIILQQTRVNQGWAYWERFMEHFPTVNDLAAAPEDEVLRLWQGLGYYWYAHFKP